MRKLGLGPLLVLLSVCQATPDPDTPPRPITDADEDAQTGSALVFPPAPTRRERRPLPAFLGQAAPHEPIVVSTPELDDDRHFEFVGQTLYVRFNRALAGKKDRPSRPPLAVTPAVSGTARWSGDYGIEFEADAPFDPQTRYQVELAGLKEASGAEIPTWSATFRADPRIFIGHKMIAYVPVPHEPRKVDVRPYATALVSPTTTFSVLWDQPVVLGEIEPRLGLFVHGVPVETRVRHARRGMFGGAKVDRRNIVEITARKPFPRDATVVLRVDDVTYPHQVAAALRFAEVACAAANCRWDGATKTVVTEDGALELAFNNPLPEADLQKTISFDPPVPNLSAWTSSWTSDGRLNIQGAFKPSSTYTLRLGAIKDVYGSTLPDHETLTVRTAPEPASVAMTGGWTYLDARESRAFVVHGRNVERAALKVWDLEESGSAWQDANQRLMRREPPADAPSVTVPIVFAPVENTFVSHEIDLLTQLRPGRSYLASLEVETTAFGAPRPPHPDWSWAARPPMALLTPNEASALLVHARSSGTSVLAHVTHQDGNAVAGAELWLDGQRIRGVTTDPQGLALFRIPQGAAPGGVLRVQQGTDQIQLALGLRTQSQSELVPELATGNAGPVEPLRGLVMTDRGIYRPGATLHLKASVRTPGRGATLPAVPLLPVRVRLVSPSGPNALEHVAWTNELGNVVVAHAIPKTAEIGRYRLLLEPLLGGTPLAETSIQVAEFEPPRFKVDVEAQAQASRLKAKVEGRYLFGAAMDEASVTWTIQRAEESFPAGPFVARGLQFRPLAWNTSAWSRTGQGKLDLSGHLELDEALEVPATNGPQRFTLEAEVQDTSHRAIANRTSVVVHPQRIYGGIKVRDTWPAVGTTLPLELGVIGEDGTAQAGHRIEAVLHRIEWQRIRQPGPGGSTHETWNRVRHRTEACVVTSAIEVVSCPLTPRRSGQYEIETTVDGHAGGATRVWAWGNDGAAEPMPHEGFRLEVETERRTYAPGEVATLRYHNPFPRAQAIYTVEHEDTLRHWTKTVTAGPQSAEVELAREHAPHAHATVTLLPQFDDGAVPTDPSERTAWRMGAVRLPVDLREARLEVEVSSDKPHYEPGERATLRVHVSHAGRPVANADVALAVVDEGILRLTNHHAPDPLAALRPGRALRFEIADTRLALAETLSRSKVPGDGGGPGQASLVQSRKDFVQTALWRPDLRTDASGRVEVELALPDNLTTFRMMAVTLDESGRGGRHEAPFEVRKSWMGVPILPRFATTGDQLDAAIMVHNNEAVAGSATVTLGDARQTVTLPPGGRTRVSFPWAPTRPGTETFVFTIADADGDVRDRVEVTTPVVAPGIDERPKLTGSFRKRQDITLQVPQGARAPAGDDALWLVLGAHLRPDLGARLEFLVDYPHGCVEQTTSGILPLLAARDLLPRLGFLRYSQADLDTMIVAGLERLATMRTPSGGLAYWPGGTEPDLYGSAYALRAIALAHQLGLAGSSRLLDDVASYLEQAWTQTADIGASAEVTSSIALALAEAGRLPASSIDMLVDTQPLQGPFGLANLALALATLDGTEDRVQGLLRALEGKFDAVGRPQASLADDAYYGSEARSQAQALLAFARLEPNAPLAPVLENALIRETSQYTTQATAFGLIALRERLLQTPVNPTSWRVDVDGRPLTPDPSTAQLGGYGQRFRIPWQGVEGRNALLTLHGAAEDRVAFGLTSHWIRPNDAAGSMTATSATAGPELYRIYTTAEGEPLDLSAVKAGEAIRVALLGRHAEEADPHGVSHLAMTDRIPAGFEPVQTDLWTVARSPELSENHPLHVLLRRGGGSASHLELRDDRVHVYFDQIWGEYAAATYLLRATTPGTYAVPAAMAELMYEPDSTSYSDTVTIVVQP